MGVGGSEKGRWRARAREGERGREKIDRLKLVDAKFTRKLYLEVHEIRRTRSGAGFLDSWVLRWTAGTTSTFTTAGGAECRHFVFL